MTFPRSVALAQLFTFVLLCGTSALLLGTCGKGKKKPPPPSTSSTSGGEGSEGGGDTNPGGEGQQPPNTTPQTSPQGKGQQMQFTSTDSHPLQPTVQQKKLPGKNKSSHKKKVLSTEERNEIRKNRYNSILSKLEESFNSLQPSRPRDSKDLGKGIRITKKLSRREKKLISYELVLPDDFWFVFEVSVAHQAPTTSRKEQYRYFKIYRPELLETEDNSWINDKKGGTFKIDMAGKNPLAIIKIPVLQANVKHPEPISKKVENGEETITIIFRKQKFDMSLELPEMSPAAMDTIQA